MSGDRRCQNRPESVTQGIFRSPGPFSQPKRSPDLGTTSPGRRFEETGRSAFNDLLCCGLVTGALQGAEQVA